MFVERFSHAHGGLEVDTRRSLVVRSVSDCNFSATDNAEGTEWCFEDVVTRGMQLKRQKSRARQLNVENQGTHISNDGGDLWMLGYKTERGGTLLGTHAGGRSAVLGGFSYTTTAGTLSHVREHELLRVDVLQRGLLHWRPVPVAGRGTARRGDEDHREGRRAYDAILWPPGKTTMGLMPSCQRQDQPARRWQPLADIEIAA